MDKITLNITGMVCGGCANNVRQALLALDGVHEAQVSQPEGRAEIVFDSAVTTPAALRAAVAKLGYQAG